MFRCLIVAAVCILVADASSAQMGKNDTRALRGLKSIALFVDGIDEESQRCGITESLIRDAFLFPISQSKVQFSDDKKAPSFWIRVNVVIQRQPNQCVASLELAVINYQKVQLDYTDEPPVWAFVRLWDDSWVFVGASLPQRLRDAVESSTKRFLTTWNLANKP